MHNEPRDPGNPNYRGSNPRMPWRLSIAVGAMRALCANERWMSPPVVGPWAEQGLTPRVKSPEEIAQTAFAIADAMFAEYQKTRPRGEQGRGGFTTEGTEVHGGESKRLDVEEDTSPRPSPQGGEGEADSRSSSLHPEEAELRPLEHLVHCATHGTTFDRRTEACVPCEVGLGPNLKPACMQCGAVLLESSLGPVCGECRRRNREATEGTA